MGPKSRSSLRNPTNDFIFEGSHFGSKTFEYIEIIDSCSSLLTSGHARGCVYAVVATASGHAIELDSITISVFRLHFYSFEHISDCIWLGLCPVMYLWHACSSQMMFIGISR